MSLLFAPESSDRDMGPAGASSSALPDWLAAEASLLKDETSVRYLARHSHSFRYASRFLPPPYDTLVADVYAFCRFTDDLVDTATGETAGTLRTRLDDWKTLARHAYAGRPCGFALLDNPLSEMGRRGIPFSYAADLIDGVAMDLAPRRYATLRELEEYSHRVASVVGLWLTELVGVRDPRVLERAADMGHAMQLTNILRDVGEDLERGRLYLPLDVLARHGVAEADLAAAVRHGGLPPGWSAAMEELMAAAEARYARALGAVRHLPRFFRRPVTVSALVYRDIHTAIRRNGHDNLRRRARTTSARKVWLGIRARLPFFGDASHALRPRVAAALAAMIAAAPIGAKPPDETAFALRQFAAAEALLETSPDALAPRVQRLRALHVLSAQDERFLSRAREALGEAENHARGAGADSADSDQAATFLAYRGALDVVEARHDVWPGERLEALRRGLSRLDSAVAREPGNAEIRYLRLVSGHHLPFFFGRASDVREDFEALAALLTSASSQRTFQGEWHAAITAFVLEHGEIEGRDRDRLRRHLAAHAARGARAVAEGGDS